MAKVKAPSTRVSFTADISEVTKALNAMDQIPRRVLQNVANEIKFIAQEELFNTFVEAIDQQSEEAFPDEFRAHMMDVVSNAEFLTSVGGTSFELFFDFNQLGDRKDLERAFHQGAILADGTRLDGPYTGQALRNDAPERHIYWEAIRKGLNSVPNPKGPGNVHFKPDAWEQTKNKYIEIWGDKAPQWLYLQFGQQAWEPKIKSFPIIETFSSTLRELAEQTFFNHVAQEIEYAQNQGAVFTPFGPRLTRPTNEIGPSGKPRRPGQFYPLR